MTLRGSSFQTLGEGEEEDAAATGKAQSPTVDSRVRRTISEDDDAERRRRGPRTEETRHRVLSSANIAER